MVRSMISARKTLGLLAALVAFTALSAGAAEGGRSVKVAVVDIDRLIQPHKEKARADVKTRYEADLEALRRQQAAIVADKKQLDADPRSPENVELVKDRLKLEMRIAELRSNEATLRARLDQEELQILSNMWAVISESIAKYAKDKGIDIVLQKISLAETPGSAASLSRAITASTVLFNADYLDCTEDVNKLVTAELQRRSAGPLPTPVKPGKEK